jgi:hypothetical protein
MRFAISLLALLVAGSEVTVMALEGPQDGHCSVGTLACCEGSGSDGQIDGVQCNDIDEGQQCFATLACCPAEEAGYTPITWIVGLANSVPGANGWRFLYHQLLICDYDPKNRYESNLHRTSIVGTKERTWFLGDSRKSLKWVKGSTIRKLVSDLVIIA